VHKRLVAKLEEGFRERTILLISRAFQSISAANLAKYLGVSTADAVTFAQSRGWKKNGDFIFPIPPEDSKVVLGTSANFQSLSEYVVYLETDLSIPQKVSDKPSKGAQVAPKGHGKGHAK